MAAFVSIFDAVVDEGDGVAVFTLRLSEAVASAISIDVDFFNFGADNGFDWSYPGVTRVTFNPNQTTRTVSVPLIANGLAELPESFGAFLVNPLGGIQIGRSRAVATIIDDDRTGRAPVASVADVWVDESDGFARFAITLDRAATTPVTVNYRTVAGSATGGADFAGTNSSVTFAAGETAKTVSVAIVNDSAAEGLEQFFFDLTGISGPSGTVIGDGRAVATIGVSDGATVATPTLIVDDVVVGEGSDLGLATIVFRLSAPSAADTSVTVGMFGWDATPSGFDYHSYADFTLSFAAGQTLRTLSVPISEFQGAEGLERFGIRLSTGVGLRIDDPFAMVTIVDNDTTNRAPVATVWDVNVDESDGFANFHITLDRGAAVPVTVTYRTVARTADAADFTPATGSVTFNPGETAKTVAVAIINDTLAEGIEQFDFELTGISGLSGAQIGDGRATATIGLSEGPASATPVLIVDNQIVSEGDSRGFVDMVFRLSARSTAPASFTFNTFDWNATASGFDYFGYGSTTLTFAAGETLKRIAIPLSEFQGIEGVEHFGLRLFDGIGLRIDDPLAMVTIIDNDDSSRAPIASVFDLSVDESDGFAAFSIILDRSAAVPVTVNWRTVAGTAGAADFAGGSGSVTFNPGETVKTVPIAIANDTLAEGIEQFGFELTGISGVSGAQLGQRAATATIGVSDGGTVATPVLLVEDLVVGEFSPTGFVPVAFRLSRPSAAVASVTFETFNWTATGSGFDYFGYGATTISFAPGETIKTIQIPLSEFQGVEDPEQFGIRFSNGVGLTVADPLAMVTIIDNDRTDRAPFVSVRDVALDESDGFANFAVILDRAASTPLTVSYRTVNGTAVAGSDYVAQTGALVFLPGETAKTVRVRVIDDTVGEAPETFSLKITGLSGVGGAAVADGVGVATIGRSDGGAAATPVLSVADITVSEGDALGHAEFRLTLSARSTTATSVTYFTSSGTATGSGFDYLGYSATAVTFAPGETVKTVKVPLANNSTVEGPETFFLNLSNPVGLTLARTQATATIVDDDPTRMSIAARNPELNEGNAGTRGFTFAIAREGVVSASQVVSWAVTGFAGEGAGAANAADFAGGVLPGGSVTFAPNETLRTITVQVAGDTAVENNENFRVTLSNPSAGVVLTNASASATILNDDVPPPAAVLSIAAITAEAVEGNAGTTAFSFAVTRAGSTAGAASASFAVTGSGASPATGADFAGGALPTGTVSFAAGQTSATVTVLVAGDTLVEPDQGFTVTLSNPSAGAAIGTASASALILDDEPRSLTGGSGPDGFTGFAGNDTLRGNGGADTLVGRLGNDVLVGGAGNDTLIGGLGADRLNGGGGADRFVYLDLSDSTPAFAGRDRILDFNAAAGDRIDLSAIDANPFVAGDQAFTLVAGDFTGGTGQISVANFGTEQLVRLDVDGDGVTDFALTVVTTTALTATAFIL